MCGMNRNHPQSEAELKSLIRQAADLRGLYRFTVPPDPRIERGFPDLTLLGSNGLVFREIKDAYREVTPDQQAWGARLNDVLGGDSWHVWRPADWVSGEIEACLDEIV
jgi:hypothetical protein